MKYNLNIHYTAYNSVNVGTSIQGSSENKSNAVLNLIPRCGVNQNERTYQYYIRSTNMNFNF